MDKAWKVLVALALCCGMISCSSEKETKPETGSAKPGAIEQFTDKTAVQVEQKIRTPIDKAKATQGLGEERTNAIDEAMKKQ